MRVYMDVLNEIGNAASSTYANIQNTVKSWAARTWRWILTWTAWNIFCAIIVTVATIAGLAVAIVTLKLAIWTAKKDYWQWCQNEQDEHHPLPPSCKEILLNPLQKPPDSRVRRDKLFPELPAIAWLSGFLILVAILATICGIILFYSKGGVKWLLLRFESLTTSIISYSQHSPREFEQDLAQLLLDSTTPRRGNQPNSIQHPNTDLSTGISEIPHTKDPIIKIGQEITESLDFGQPQGAIGSEPSDVRTLLRESAREQWAQRVKDQMEAFHAPETQEKSRRRKATIKKRRYAPASPWETSREKPSSSTTTGKAKIYTNGGKVYGSSSAKHVNSKKYT